MTAIAFRWPEAGRPVPAPAWTFYNAYYANPNDGLCAPEPVSCRSLSLAK